ncbi:MAG: DUF2807 domain-containing protein [Bacteroidetes bacterium]|nr:DUF2807 domain-containing protein [Bacteroidota bacterium]
MKLLANRLPVFLCLAGLFSACFPQQDPGPVQFDRRSYALMGFDRVEADEALMITLQSSPSFSVYAEGDRRNLDDLVVVKLGNTLRLGFSSFKRRDHPTYLTIQLPVLNNLLLSGASNAMASGFHSDMGITLSGGSVGQFDLQCASVSLIISGASRVTLTGKATAFNGNVSGMSALHAADMSADRVEVVASGSSEARVWANETLKATASGSSIVFYKGSPSVTATVTDGSDVRPN